MVDVTAAPAALAAHASVWLLRAVQGQIPGHTHQMKSVSLLFVSFFVCLNSALASLCVFVFGCNLLVNLTYVHTSYLSGTITMCIVLPS